MEGKEVHHDEAGEGAQAFEEARAAALADAYGVTVEPGESKPASEPTEPSGDPEGDKPGNALAAGGNQPEEGDPLQGDAPGQDAEAKADKDSEPSDLERHASTTTGRLRAAEERLAAVMQELEALRTAKPAAAPEPEAPKPVELPEALQSDAAEFDELAPQLAPLLRDPGPLGEALRKTLEQHGAVPAMQQARLAMLEHELDSLKQERASETSEAVSRAHAEAIVSQHPEVRGLFGDDPVERLKARRFKDAVTLWVHESKQDPAERDAAFGILSSGSAKDVNLLLSEYKQSLSASRSAVLDDDAKRRASLAGGVDNKSGSRPKTKPKNDRSTAVQEVYGK